jgi:hypothetical protein
VVGDRAVDALSARPRKVFAKTDGPYSCRTGRRATPEDVGVESIPRFSEPLCWGTLVHEHENAP